MISLSVDKMQSQNELKFNVKNIVTRSPRLETVVMVERFIKENSGNYKKTELLNKLPKKMMWGTFNVILKYLFDSNKIGADRLGHIIYIWNPEAGKRFKSRRRY